MRGVEFSLLCMYRFELIRNNFFCVSTLPAPSCVTWKSYQDRLRENGRPALTIFLLWCSSFCLSQKRQHNPRETYAVVRRQKTFSEEQMRKWGGGDIHNTINSDS